MASKKSQKGQTRNRLKRAAPGTKPDKTVVTGMHNELRAQILILLNERVASRPELCKELGASFDNVRYEMEVLKKTKPPLIELVHEKPVRGTVEKFYRATKQAYLDRSEWPGVPDAVKVGMRGSLLALLVDDAVAAVEEGTFDSLENAHMSWTPMILDVQGWEDLTALLLRAMEEAIKVKEDSAARLIANDEEGTSCAVSILGYPSANEKRKVGPPASAAESKSKKKAAPRKARSMRQRSKAGAPGEPKRKASAKPRGKGAGK
jgi:hypothetical protein